MDLKPLIFKKPRRLSPNIDPVGCHQVLTNCCEAFIQNDLYWALLQGRVVILEICVLREAFIKNDLFGDRSRAFAAAPDI